MPRRIATRSTVSAKTNTRDERVATAGLLAGVRVLCLMGITALLSPAPFVFAQAVRELPPPSYFIGATGADNISKASIDAYDGSSYCGTFQNGKQIALSPLPFVGVTVPFDTRWSIGGVLRYTNLSTSFDIPVSSTNPPLALDQQGNQYYQIDRRRTFDANLGMMSVSALVSFDLVSRLKLCAGPFAGLIVQHTYTESEYLTSAPSAYYPENGSRTRTMSSGDLPGTHTFQAGVEYGLSYELPFQPRLWLRPSIGGMLPLTSISDRSSTPWRIYPLAASLSLVYRAFEPEVIPPPKQPIFANDSLLVVPHPRVAIVTPPPPPPESQKKKAVLQVSIKAFGVLDDGTETPQPTLTIERMHVTEVYPMLHYVFFDDGSADIPARYHRESLATKANFNEKNLFTANALEIHHHVLDILGHRLAENPKATITLLGTRSEHSPLDSMKGSAIARGRAESIASYLNTVWGIAPERVRIKARDLPDAPSDDHNASGEAENRRVEIVPSSADIVSPLWTERIERVATPPRIDFSPDIMTGAGVLKATITVRQGEHVLQTFDALTGSSTGEYMWTLSGASMPEKGDSLSYTFDVVDSLGDTATSKGIILLKQETRDITKHETDTSLDKQLQRYSLILFDYSSSQLDKRQSDKIVREIANAINDGSAITLTGHTDKTGDDAFNTRLAMQRVSHAADMLGDELKKMGKEKPAMLVESHGSKDVLFDNSIPEGRVLSRTVRALIESDNK